MRVGSMVAIVRLDDDGAFVVAENNTGGIAIAVEIEHLEDRDSIGSVTVRWDNGKVETLRMEWESSGDYFELADVTPLLYANLYLSDRAWGWTGSASSGWYDIWLPADGNWVEPPPPHGHFENQEEAAKALHDLQVWCDEENTSRRSPSSVASEGHFIACLEAWPAEPHTSLDPHCVKLSDISRSK